MADQNLIRWIKDEKNKGRSYNDISNYLIEKKGFDPDVVDEAIGSLITENSSYVEEGEDSIDKVPKKKDDGISTFFMIIIIFSILFTGLLSFAFIYSDSSEYSESEANHTNALNISKIMGTYAYSQESVADTKKSGGSSFNVGNFK